MEKVLITQVPKTNNQFVLFRGNFILKTFDTKYTGFKAIAELLHKEEIDWADARELANSIMHEKKIRYCPEDVKDLDATPTGYYWLLASIVQAAQKTHRNIVTTAEFYERIKNKELPLVLLCQNEDNVFYGEIALQMPFVKMEDETFVFDLGTSEQFETRSLGISIARKEFKNGRIPKEKHRVLQEQIKHLKLPRTILELEETLRSED